VANLAGSRIGQIAIVARDVARAKSFYHDTLGLPFLFDAGPKLAFLKCGDVRLMITTSEGRDEFDPPGSVLYFFVDDIQRTYSTLREQAVTFVAEPHVIAKMPDHDLWLAEFKDSEGNYLALMSEVRPPA
jgi:methylmalonyl-CoA/ethylmalonyl-CoA epimerase